MHAASGMSCPRSRKPKRRSKRGVPPADGLEDLEVACGAYLPGAQNAESARLAVPLQTDSARVWLFVQTGLQSSARTISPIGRGQGRNRGSQVMFRRRR